ncbi:MAG: transcription-repair coupling factor [Oscillospiraceae bacterium]|jgi:transcription-repair coupling factor (superfamily II helicase)|nr:transcription-repair coupling factor [Oscillospiraceae bacterium]
MLLALSKAITKEPQIRGLMERVKAGGAATPAVISGLSGIHRAHLAAAIRAETGSGIVVICADETECAKMGADLAILTGGETVELRSREYTFRNVEGVSRQSEQARISALFKIAGGAPLIVATIDGLLQRAIPKNKLMDAVFEISAKGVYDIKELAAQFERAGYHRCDQVEGRGQFAVRGGILDFFSPVYGAPARCEFFGDEVDSLCWFDAETQRRTGNAEQVLVLPVAETLPQLYSDARGGGSEGLVACLNDMALRLRDRKAINPALIACIEGDVDRLDNRRPFPSADKYIELIYDMATGLDYIPEDSIFFVSDPAHVKERANNYMWQLGEDVTALLEAGVLESGLARFYEDFDAFTSRLSDRNIVMADSFAVASYPWRPRSTFNLTVKQLPSYGGSLETAAGDINHYKNSGYSTLILCRDTRRAASLLSFLEQHGAEASLDVELKALPGIGQCIVTVGALSAGMEYPGIKLAVITEGQILDRFTAGAGTRRKREKKNRERLQSFTDLSPGDLVVHEHHGIGRFVGIFKMPVDGIEKDYIKIEYAGGDCLYVPATQLDLVAKYIGAGEDAQTRLSKMGGTEWSRAKSRAKAAAKDMAKDLIALYAERQRTQGHAFAPDSAWQSEFEDRFGYQETDDQIKCIEEIKADMERPIPMDRLLCGDVGYGKTEVALRAVMKCVMDGWQAAILAPTTVLAQQHYITAVRRFAGYPVNIAVLSRFQSAAEIRRRIREIAAGSVDIVIGTHRILQKDVKFCKLGLLIVDEEQRFGVTHKERLKEMARRVDVLTLSATPIPRTLNMALSGIRDMSTIEEPPRDRQPVQTYVLEHDWSLIIDAIIREISRGGQVYYLHNRIDNIERTAARIAAAIEGAVIAIAHGKMDEESLSGVMDRMASGEIQVLVCTTIIETGIDIPNVNTLVIEDSDRMGLAQLHQIRGRVGRSPRRAYAYLTFRQGKLLTETAEKRLSTIREFAEFNSGFKIAMRDLEIRGAGNLLGAEQSGHMVSVGYDMYLKLLEEAVLEERGEKQQKRVECVADLAVSAFLPDDYVPSGEQRVDVYRRIANIHTVEDSEEMIAELIDRYGDPPDPAAALVTIAVLRAEAANAGIIEIAQKGGWLQMKLTDFDMARISALYAMAEFNGRIRVEAGTVPALAVKLRGASPQDEALRFVRVYAAFASASHSAT